MLKDWPEPELFWWSCLPDQGERFGQRVQEARYATIPARFYPYRRLARFKSLFLETLWSRVAAGHLRRMLRDVVPDAVWVIPHNWSIVPVAKVMADPRHKFHITVQDYVDVHNNPQRFGVGRCRRMAAMVDGLYSRAVTRDATSHPMIADLLAHTGKDAAQMLHAGLERADFDFLEHKVPGKSPAVRIAYAGTILVEDVFELFVAAVESIRGTLAKPVEIHLYGAHTYAGRRWFRRDWMVEHGILSEPELRAKLRECDWGFAPMSLTDSDHRYNRFSFPTKFITCLAAGLPLITLGHPESAVMKMAAQYPVGFASSSREKETLAVQLKAALEMHSPWEQYAPEIKHCARKEFNAERMRRTLYACFQKCAEQGPRR